eukprot:gene12697-biopygen9337
MVAFSLAGAANEAMQAARAKAAERAAAKAAAAKAAAKARKSKGKQALQLFSRTVSLLAPREAPAALAPAPQDPVEKMVEECRSTAAALRQWAEQCGPQLQRAATSATTTTISGLPEPLQQALNGSVHAIALQADAVAAAARLEASYLDAIAGELPSSRWTSSWRRSASAPQRPNGSASCAAGARACADGTRPRTSARPPSVWLQLSN